MKKNYLIIFENMNFGGIEKSIVSLLDEIDYRKVSINFLLLQKKGEFLNYINKNVNLLESEIPESFFFSLKQSLQKLPTLKWKLKRFYYSILKLLERKNIILNRNSKQYLAKLIKKQETNYDVAIAYTDWQYDYLIDFTKAKKKYIYIHVDYQKSYYNPKRDYRFFKSCDGILTVSDDSQKSIYEVFPEVKGKIKTIKNIISKNTILKMSEEKGFRDDFKGIRVLTVCRLSKEKGLDIAIDTCLKLVEKGYNLKWYLIGDGYIKKNLEKKVKSLNLENNFIFKGLKINPYPFFKECDIYVQPSLHEGFGLTVAEAKIFKKPIVVSNIKVFGEQITHKINGLIAEKNHCSFSKNIELLIKDSILRNKLKNNLEKENKENKENNVSMNKFYKL